MGEVSKLPQLLLVEDHAVTRQLIPAMLKGEFTVTGVATAEAAIARAEQEAFDVFLVDINLGAGGNGFDVLEGLRQRSQYKNTPIIACTAFAMKGDKEEFLEAGFDAYLAKPFTRDQLRQMLRDLLRSGRASS